MESGRFNMDKKEKILNAAIEVLFQKSFYDATMEDIAKISGVKKSTIYYYYSSKLDLVFELLKESITTLFGKLKDMLINTEDPKDKIETIVNYYIKTYKENYKLFIAIQRIGYDFMKSKDEKEKMEQFFKKLKEEKLKLGKLFGDVVLSTGKKVSGEIFTGSLLGSLGRAVFEKVSQGEMPNEKELKEIKNIFIAALS